MKLQDYAPFAASLVLVGVTACGGATAKTSTDTPVDSGPAPAVTDSGTTVVVADTGVADAAPDVDHGSVSTTYPAFTPDIGQITNNGGPVLAKPEIVTVTWPGDTNAATYEAFGDGLGKSQYWATSVTEYGVGVTTSGPANHVRMTTPLAATMSDMDIANYVAQQATAPAESVDAGADGGTDAAPAAAAWPAPTANTIYTLYIPATTSVQLQGADACQQGVGGYHDNVMAGSLNVAYAVVLECSEFAGPGGLVQEVTQSASHEIVEGSTDPSPNVDPAWIGFDDDKHIAWDIFQQFQDEIGDACELYQNSFYTDTESAFNFGVQRMWSNKSGAAGHDPCVPVASGPYYNVTLLDPEDITVDASMFGMSSKFPSKGIRILSGQTKTFAIGFYSDAATTPWNITAYEGNPLFGPMGTTSNLEITLDVNKGQNGNKAYLTVKVKSQGSMNAELIAIASSQSTGQFAEYTANYMPILIGSQ